MEFKKKIENCIFQFCQSHPKIGLRIWHTYRYLQLRKKIPNFKHPKTLSEHIISIMHTPTFLKYADLADKVKVHEYIKAKGFEDILLKHYAIWDNVEDIDISDLPNKFVLKPNNGSGGHVYCRDKSSFDLENARQILRENLERAEGYFMEPHYLNIEPKIFAEEFLDLGEGKTLIDYKFTCVKGEIVDVFLAGEDESGKRGWQTVDEQWHILPYIKEDYRLSNLPSKPHKFQQMLEIAKCLSKDFEFVRVDLYEYNDRVYFSELTFSPWGGLLYGYTNEADELLGKKFK